MAAYYNEIDPFAAAWLRELIKSGLIAPGEVDERSIADVAATDLVGFTQCHFFAGIAVWSYALRCAGWPDDRQVWTGSCPCQPFSSAGRGAGFKDERHLWPEFYRLISQCRPAVCFGEQVASKDGLAWLDLVQADMENANYAFGALDTCAAGVGAPHIRQRLYWVADAEPQRLQRRLRGGDVFGTENQHGHVGRNCAAGRLADANSLRCEPTTSTGLCPNPEYDAEPYCHLVGLAHTEHEQRQGGISGCAEKFGENGGGPASEFARCGKAIRLDNSECNGRGARRDNDGEHDRQQLDATGFIVRPGPTNGHWRDADWLLCRDGKWRAVESIAIEMADGLANRLGYSRFGDLFSLNPLKESEKEDMRVGRLRGYGNAIVAPQAQAFIEAFMEIMEIKEQPCPN